MEERRSENSVSKGGEISKHHTPFVRQHHTCNLRKHVTLTPHHVSREMKPAYPSICCCPVATGGGFDTTSAATCSATVALSAATCSATVPLSATLSFISSVSESSQWKDRFDASLPRGACGGDRLACADCRPRPSPSAGTCARGLPPLLAIGTHSCLPQERPRLRERMTSVS